MPSTDPPNDSTSSQLDGLVPLIPVALGLLGDSNDLSSLKLGLRAWAKKDPMDALLATVIGGGLAYYLAERHTNASCKNPWDGVLFMASTLGMIQDPVAPTTPTGRTLTAFVRTFAPSLAFAALEPTASEVRATEAEKNAVQLAILERLDRIVNLLEQKPA
ncbi:MAG: hypothetical protein M4D80_22745 [Myxococcota bacterium]|nr:hypothetical protein [Myxococcota bacterium]